MITPEQLEEWKALAEKARKEILDGGGLLSAWNVSFSLASRTAIPALVAEVEKLQEALRSIAGCEAPAGGGYDMIALARAALPEEPTQK